MPRVKKCECKSSPCFKCIPEPGKHNGLLKPHPLLSFSLSLSHSFSIFYSLLSTDSWSHAGLSYWWIQKPCDLLCYYGKHQILGFGWTCAWIFLFLNSFSKVFLFFWAQIFFNKLPQCCLIKDFGSMMYWDGRVPKQMKVTETDGLGMDSLWCSKCV